MNKKITAGILLAIFTLTSCGGDGAVGSSGGGFDLPEPVAFPVEGLSLKESRDYALPVINETDDAFETLKTVDKTFLKFETPDQTRITRVDRYLGGILGSQTTEIELMVGSSKTPEELYKSLNIEIPSDLEEYETLNESEDSFRISFGDTLSTVVVEIDESEENELEVLIEYKRPFSTEERDEFYQVAAGWSAPIKFEGDVTVGNVSLELIENNVLRSLTVNKKFAEDEVSDEALDDYMKQVVENTPGLETIERTREATLREGKDLQLGGEVVGDYVSFLTWRRAPLLADPSGGETVVFELDLYEVSPTN